ncbi:hypothetical protein BDB01DRAFT_789307 [Pilobolus umbonatus]|nr:hypothetical protein BDB01DRAFT_789307 [Pilobolus umbonatus]
MHNNSYHSIPPAKLPGIMRLPYMDNKRIQQQSFQYMNLVHSYPHYNAYYDHMHSSDTVVSPPLTPAGSPSMMQTDTRYDYLDMPYMKTETNYSHQGSSIDNDKRIYHNKPKQKIQQHKHACQYDECNWSFKRYEHLKRHMLVHTGERPHVCPFIGCGKSFSRSDNFHAHYKTHYKKTVTRGTQKKKKKDKACETEVSDIATNAAAVALLQSMDKQHSDYERSYSYMYDRKEEYPSYLFPMSINHASPSLSLLNHETYQQNSVFMTDCGQSTSESMSSNNSTSSSHGHGNIEYYPERTDYSFDYQDEATDIKLHMCPIGSCSRKFKRLEHLKRHMRIHTMERPFTCSYLACTKSFSRSDNLSQHIKTHQRQHIKKKK